MSKHHYTKFNLDSPIEEISNFFSQLKELVPNLKRANSPSIKYYYVEISNYKDTFVVNFLLTNVFIMDSSKYVTPEEFLEILQDYILLGHTYA